MHTQAHYAFSSKPKMSRTFHSPFNLECFTLNLTLNNTKRPIKCVRIKCICTMENVFILSTPFEKLLAQFKRNAKCERKKKTRMNSSSMPDDNVICFMCSIFYVVTNRNFPLQKTTTTTTTTTLRIKCGVRNSIQKEKHREKEREKAKKSHNESKRSSFMYFNINDTITKHHVLHMNN